MRLMRIQRPAFDARRILVAPQLGNDVLEKGVPLEQGKALIVAQEAGRAWCKHTQGHAFKVFLMKPNAIQDREQDSLAMSCQDVHHYKLASIFAGPALHSKSSALYVDCIPASSQQSLSVSYMFVHLSCCL